MSSSQLPTSSPSPTPSPTPPPDEYDSPPWSLSTKTIVTVAALILVVWLTYRFQSLIGQLVTAAILAYILNPIIIFIDRRTPFRRSIGILTVYLLLAVGVIGAGIALGVAAVEQVNSLINQIPRFIENATGLIQSFTTRTEPFEFGPIVIDPITIDWQQITNQLLQLVNPLVTQSGQLLRNVATTTMRLLGVLLFVFVISIYIATEIPQLSGYVSRLANQPGYRKDAERLMREFGRIWSAYLRGQVILGLVIFFVVWIGLSLLGVQNSLALGILSGLLEFVPVIGPVVGAGAAIIVAFFQPDNYLGLAPIWHALLVLGFMFIVQQLENSVLVPRIVGESLDLHPLIVMVGVFMGSSLAGILGAVLAAPVVATLKLLGIYAWRKMFDLPPFPKPEEEPPPPKPSLRDRMTTAVQLVRNRW